MIVLVMRQSNRPVDKPHTKSPTVGIFCYIKNMNTTLFTQAKDLSYKFPVELKRTFKSRLVDFYSYLGSDQYRIEHRDVVLLGDQFSVVEMYEVSPIEWQTRTVSVFGTLLDAVEFTRALHYASW